MILLSPVYFFTFCVFVYNKFVCDNRSSINQAPNVAQLASEESTLWSEQFLNEEPKEMIPPYNPGELTPPVYEQSAIATALDNSNYLEDDKLKPVQATLNDLSNTWSIDFEKMKTFDESQFGLGKEWIENFLKNADEVKLEEEATKEKKEDGGSSKVVSLIWCFCTIYYLSLMHFSLKNLVLSAILSFIADVRNNIFY